MEFSGVTQLVLELQHGRLDNDSTPHKPKNKPFTSRLIWLFLIRNRLKLFIVRPPTVGTICMTKLHVYDHLDPMETI
jgi:hypothetical protein